MKIYKYNFNFTMFARNGVADISLPVGAKILTIQNQDGELKLWAIVDEKQSRMYLERFFIWGTGFDFPDTTKLKYFTTVQIDSFVWHIFTE